MDLEFDERLLLAPGVHDATLENVKEKFGAFQKSDRRSKLFARLGDFVDAARRTGVASHLLIDGSFVMACVDEPDDIDIVLVLPVDWDTEADLPPYKYNMVSTRAIKRTFGFDVFVVESGSIEETKWLDYFGQVKPDWCERFGWPVDLRKGIVRITL